MKGLSLIIPQVNFTQYYVGGKRGGPVTEQTWNSSFHGYGEVTGAIYQLCARKLDTTAHKTKWLKCARATPPSAPLLQICYRLAMTINPVSSTSEAMCGSARVEPLPKKTLLPKDLLSLKAHSGDCSCAANNSNAQSVPVSSSRARSRVLRQWCLRRGAGHRSGSNR